MGKSCPDHANPLSSNVFRQGQPCVISCGELQHAGSDPACVGPCVLWVYGVGFRVQGAGCRVWGVGCGGCKHLNLGEEEEPLLSEHGPWCISLKPNSSSPYRFTFDPACVGPCVHTFTLTHPLTLTHTHSHTLTNSHTLSPYRFTFDPACVGPCVLALSCPAGLSI